MNWSFAWNLGLNESHFYICLVFQRSLDNFPWTHLPIILLPVSLCTFRFWVESYKMPQNRLFPCYLAESTLIWPESLRLTIQQFGSVDKYLSVRSCSGNLLFSVCCVPLCARATEEVDLLQPPETEPGSWDAAVDNLAPGCIKPQFSPRLIWLIWQPSHTHFHSCDLVNGQKIRDRDWSFSPKGSS